MDLYLDPEAELLRQVEEGKASNDELTADKVAQAIQHSMTNHGIERSLGCCRVYVCISSNTPTDTLMQGIKATRAHTKQFAQTVLPLVLEGCQKAGRRFQYKGHEVTNAIYIGYDNNTGVEHGRGQAVAAALKQLGLSAYVEVVGD
jgi:hypothetical protein